MPRSRTPAPKRQRIRPPASVPLAHAVAGVGREQLHLQCRATATPSRHCIDVRCMLRGASTLGRPRPRAGGCVSRFVGMAPTYAHTKSSTVHPCAGWQRRARCRRLRAWACSVHTCATARTDGAAMGACAVAEECRMKNVVKPENETCPRGFAMRAPNPPSRAKHQFAAKVRMQGWVRMHSKFHNGSQNSQNKHSQTFARRVSRNSAIKTFASIRNHSHSSRDSSRVTRMRECAKYIPVSLVVSEVRGASPAADL